MSQIIENYDYYLSQGKFGNEVSILHDTYTIYDGLLRLIQYHSNYDLTKYLHSPVPEVAICTRRIVDKAFMLLSLGQRDNAIKEIEWILSNIDSIDSKNIIQDNKSPLIFDYSNVFKADIAQRLNSSFKKDGFEGVDFVIPDMHQTELIQNSFKLLDTFLPNVIKSSFAFIKGFTVVKTGFESAYNREAPQIFLINTDVIIDSLFTAEFLLHESLHQKMNDLQVTRPIMVDSYDDFASHEKGDVKLPWGLGKPRPFSLVRAVATFHVYVHLSVLYKLALLKMRTDASITNFSTAKIQKRFLNAYNRASYISNSLLSEYNKQYYNEEGEEFLNWLQYVMFSIKQDEYMSKIISSKPNDFYE